MAEVTLKVNHICGSFTIDPTTLVANPEASIRWRAEIVNNDGVVDDAPVFAIQFTGNTPLEGGHMLWGSAEGRDGDRALAVNSGRYEYAAAVTYQQNVFIHTSGEILVDPGGQG